MKTEKASGPSEVLLEMNATSRGVGIQVMAEICQKVLVGLQVEWVLNLVVPNFKGRVTSGSAAAIELGSFISME